MNVDFSDRFLRVSYTCSSDYSVYDGWCTYTHLLHAHLSVAQFVCAHPHIFMRVLIHAWLKCLWKGVCTCVVSLHLACSLLMIHPSSLLFLDGHLETTPDYEFTDDPVHAFLPYLLVQKNAGHAPLRTCIAKFGYFAAKSDANTGYEPKKFDKNTSVDDDTTLINDPDHNTSDFSKTTNENTRQFGVPTVFESSVSHVSHDDLALQIESKESMQSGNRCWTERNRRKIMSCDQWCRVDVKERSTERCQCESEESQKILFLRVSENSVLMDEISENIFNEELDKRFMVKIQFREDYIWMSTSWRSKIWSEEILNMCWLSRSLSLNLKDNNSLKLIRANSTWENTFV